MKTFPFSKTHDYFFLNPFLGFAFVLVLKWFFLDAVQNVHIYLKISRLIRKSPALHHWSNTLFPAKIVRFIIEFGSSPRKFCVYSRKVWLFPKSASKMRIQSQLLSPLCITLMYNSFFSVLNSLVILPHVETCAKSK